MFVKSLRISNLRSIASAEVSFCHPGSEEPPELPNVTLLLGDNGVGKTSVLRAVALSILSPLIESSGFTPYNLVRRTGAGVMPGAGLEAELVLHEQDLTGTRHSAPLNVEVTAEIVRRGDVERVVSPAWGDNLWEGMFHESSPAFLVVGYSAGRRVEGAASFDTSIRAKSRNIRYQRVAGLFEEGVTLTPLGAWLPRFQGENKGRYSQVIRLINDLLPEGTRITDQMENNGEYLFEHNGTKVPFGAMSDGYRAYIGWIADLLYHVCMGAPKGKKLVDNYGVVLVDEIDLHLHPAWQREVVPQLARALPNLQFVLTTHSPIVAGTLQAANIRLIEPDETGASTIQRINERIHGLNADQILVSSYFGLESTRAPEAVNTLRSLSRKARRGDDDAVYAFLKELSAESDEWTGSGEAFSPHSGSGAARSGTARTGSAKKSASASKTPASAAAVNKTSGGGAKKTQRAENASGSSRASNKARAKSARSRRKDQ